MGQDAAGTVDEWHKLILIGIYTGLRLGDCCRLVWLLGQQAYDNKIKVGPVLPLVAELYGRARWRVSHELSRIFKAANIQTSVRLEGRHRRTPEATFHSLRHTFVSFAANAGVPLHIVQSIVGHESTAMTRHYYHENIDALKSAVAAIPTLGI